jgi:hypothetical protein
MIEIRKTPHADTRSCDVTTAVKETVQLETFHHIQDVGKVLNFFSEKLQKAAQEHDADKLSKFDWFWANFQTNFKERDWLENHYRVNRHHLNAEGGVPPDVDLLDVMEFVADCTAAGVARHGYVTELTLPQELLVTAFQNTVKKVVSQLRLVPEYRLTNYDANSIVHVTSHQDPAALTVIGPVEHEVVDEANTRALLHELYDVERESAAMSRETAVQTLLQEPNPMYAEEVAELLECDKSTVHSYGRRGLIFSVKYGRRTRYCRKSVQALIDSGFKVPNLGKRAKLVSKKRDALQGRLFEEPLPNGTLVFAGTTVDAKFSKDFVVGVICGHDNSDAYLVHKYGEPTKVASYKVVETLTVVEAEHMLMLLDEFYSPEPFMARMRRVRPNGPVVPKLFPKPN